MNPIEFTIILASIISRLKYTFLLYKNVYRYLVGNFKKYCYKI